MELDGCTVKKECFISVLRLYDVETKRKSQFPVLQVLSYTHHV